MFYLKECIINTYQHHRTQPVDSEDSEEFLTILGKKMGKLVKGGDAEPWSGKRITLDSIACDDD